MTAARLSTDAECRGQVGDQCIGRSGATAGVVGIAVAGVDVGDDSSITHAHIDVAAIRRSRGEHPEARGAGSVKRRQHGRDAGSDGWNGKLTRCERDRSAMPESAPSGTSKRETIGVEYGEAGDHAGGRRTSHWVRTSRSAPGNWQRKTGCHRAAPLPKWARIRHGTRRPERCAKGRDGRQLNRRVVPAPPVSEKRRPCWSQDSSHKDGSGGDRENKVGSRAHRKSARNRVRGCLDGHQLTVPLRQHVDLLAVAASHHPDGVYPGESNESTVVRRTDRQCSSC